MFSQTTGLPSGVQTARKREHDVCDRARLDWSVTVMADRQDVLRSELNKIILEISLNKNAPNHNKGYG